MDRVNVIDAEAARKVLEEVAQRNQSLDLVRLLEAGEDTCRSRFIRAAGREPAIEVPSRRGHLVPVRPGEKVEVYFRLGRNRYWFSSAVRERSSLDLSPDLKLPVLILRQPKAIELRQRRRYYRIQFRVTDTLLAGLWRVGDPIGDVAPAELPPMEVLDVSAGGMRLLHAEKENCPVHEMDMLVASLPLELNAPPLKLTSHVLWVTKVAEGATHVGVEFTGLDENREGGMIRDKVQRFVAEREREELRRMKGLE